MLNYIIYTLIFGIGFNLLEKKIFERILPKKITNRPRKLSYSYGVPEKWNECGFPSGHSQLAIFLAAILSYHSKNKYWILLIWSCALLVCYQRVHVKVHSKLQVLFGGLFGFLFSQFVLISPPFPSLEFDFSSFS